MIILAATVCTSHLTGPLNSTIRYPVYYFKLYYCTKFGTVRVYGLQRFRATPRPLSRMPAPPPLHFYSFLGPYINSCAPLPQRDARPFPEPKGPASAMLPSLPLARGGDGGGGGNSA